MSVPVAAGCAVTVDTVLLQLQTPEPNVSP